MNLTLTNGTFAEVDDEDFERLSKFKWCDGVTTVCRRKGYYRTKYFSLANDVMQTKKIMYDHIDRNYRNNKKSNLREADYFQNGQNRSKMENASSKYKGVSFYKRDSIWAAHIRHEGKLIYLGRFKIEEEAAKAYDVKAKELFGEFAHLNFKQ